MWYTRMVDDEIGVFGLRWCGIEIAQLIILCELLVAVSLVHKEQKQMLVDPMWSLLSPASDAFFSILPFVFLSRRGARRETNPTGNFSGGLVTGSSSTSGASAKLLACLNADAAPRSTASRRQSARGAVVVPPPRHRTPTQLHPPPSPSAPAAAATDHPPPPRGASRPGPSDRLLKGPAARPSTRPPS